MSATGFRDVSTTTAIADMARGALGETSVDVGDQLPTGTVTLLLADVEGSTQLWQARPDAMAEAVALLDRIADELVAAHRGVRPVEQGEGDSFVAGFARASDAVACALRLQQIDLSPIKLRIGLHTGEVQLRDEGNYAGSTINKAARLRDLAHGGQTVLSGSTEELVEDRLPDGAWLTDLGTHQLRDLPRPVRVAQLGHPDLTNSFPPLRTSNSVANEHLPVQLTSFIGRRNQVAALVEMLAENRLVTLTGAGGAGKTRLAVEVARQVTDQFPEGVWYADLAPVTHPVVVPVTVARALGLPDQPGRSINETLLRHLRNRRMLLVLDNCEHLLEACATLVDDVLTSCSGVTILGTSREPLMVGGEVNWQVPSLALADEAIELFVDRARFARPGFALTATNTEAVTQICRRLDGMPLAIELAAARVRTLTTEEIVGSLHDRFRLLTGGARTAVRRQQTLRASVDWSHALLTEPERVLFRRLAVFMGGFTLDAAQVVAGATAVERYQVLDQLSLLVEKSLVVAEDSGGRSRYRLLETVRQYALEKLSESGEASPVRARHRDYYAALAARLDAPARQDYEQLLPQVDADFDNLRAAFAWSRESQDIALASELASSLSPLWLARGRLAEGLSWLDAARAESHVSEPAIWARTVADRAVLSSWVDITGMWEPVQRALTIARDIDEPILLTRVLTACAYVTMHDADLSRPFFSEAVELARALGDSWRLSQILSRQATGALLVGDVLAAESLAMEAREIADAIGDDFNSRQCRMTVAWAQVCRGEMATAVDLYADAIAEARNAHDLMSMVSGLITEPFARAFRGDVDGARSRAAAAVEACAELGYLLQAGYSAVAIAEVAAGNATVAFEAAQMAVRSEMNSAVSKHNWMWCAHAALAYGDIACARRWADEAAAATNGIYRCQALTVRARICIAETSYEQAATDAYEGLGIVSATAGYHCAPDLLESLAVLASAADNAQHAVRLLGAASAMRERLELARFRVYDGDYRAFVDGLRDTLHNNDFDARHAEGAALSTEETIAFALRGRGERKRPSAGWDSLTPTELDVVRLVAEGIPNKEIAERLFVSPRTVQSHLRHVYNKLGLASRVQLAQESVRRR